MSILLSSTGLPVLLGNGLMPLTTTSGGGGGSASGIADTTVLSQRNTLAGYHYTGDSSINNENTWMGVTDETGFTTVQVASADALRTSMQTNSTTTSKYIFELDWDGDSTLATSTINSAFTTADLSANGSMDWGYDRPTQEAIIRPASGRSPNIVAATANVTAAIFVGFSKIHIDGDVTFKGEVEFESRSTIDSTRICPTMVYLNGVTFRDTYGNSTVNAVSMRSSRVVHAENCTLINNRVGFNGAPNYFRCWNCTFYQHRDADMISIRGYGTSRGTPTNDWWSTVWISHLFAWDAQFLGSDVHQDGYQYTLTGSPAQNGQGAATGVSWTGQRLLIEYSHYIVTGQNAQGIFGDDGTAFDNQMCVHNTFDLCEAAQGLRFYDPNDNMAKAAYRSMISRTGGPGELVFLYDTVTTHPQAGEVLTDGTNTATVSSVDTASKRAILSAAPSPGNWANNANITGNLGADVLCHLPGLDPKIGLSAPAPGTTSPTGNGTMLIKETFNHNGNSIGTNGMSGVTQTGNTQMQPADIFTLLTGNGTSHTGPTGEDGYENPDVYDSGGGAPATASAAKAAWNVFLEPVAGWNGGGGGSVGPIDPDTWPTAGQETLSLGS